MDERNSVLLGKKTFPVVRYKLRDWLRLDEIRSKILKAAESGNKDEMEVSLYSYISAAFGLPVEEVKGYDWFEIAEAFAKISVENLPNQNLPMLSVTSPQEKETLPAWDYEGRSWYLWANVLAKAYGWTLDCIAELDINDALALSQEIMVDDQLDREWQWAMSEVAYSYDSASKTSKLIHLPRPAWMNYRAQESPDKKKVKMLKSMMPMGVVVKYGEKPA